MAFPMTHVKAPDQDDWKKPLHKMAHLHDTKDMALALEVDDLKMMQWCVDASLDRGASLICPSPRDLNGSCAIFLAF